MNRPFTALGALGALLALAMFAVSSSSRSTTVQPAKSAHQRQRASQGAAAVNPLTITSIDEDDWEFDHAVGSEQFGLLDSLSLLTHISQSTFSITRIELAQEIRATWLPPAPMDCLAHNDPAYDRLIYGVQDATKAVPPDGEVALQGRLELDAECLGMFHELVGQVTPAVTPQAAALRTIKHTQWKLPSAAGTETTMSQARIWLSQQIDQLAATWSLRSVSQQSVASQPLSWGEYADLIDGALDSNAAKHVAAATSGKVATVRSGD